MIQIYLLEEVTMAFEQLTSIWKSARVIRLVCVPGRDKAPFFLFNIRWYIDHPFSSLFLVDSCVDWFYCSLGCSNTS